MPLITICIPTLNRPKFLEEAILSCTDDLSIANDIEICISNNCSEEDYRNINELIFNKKSEFNIHYIEQKERLSLDEHMLYVTKMATSEYVFYLGDDDYILKDELVKIIELVKLEEPELIIFNGKIVDKDSNTIGRHFTLKPKIYHDIDSIFDDLRDKGSFGSVIVRKSLLDEKFYKVMVGTSHAYGCFWLSLLWNASTGKSVKSLIPDFPGVGLRAAEKSYSHIEVYFSHILYSMAIFRRFSPKGHSQLLLDKFENKYYRNLFSLRHLLSLLDHGCFLREIKEHRIRLYNKLYFKILLAECLFKSGIYKKLRKIKRFIKSRRKL
jgi:abequosyltransferase